ncbi:MAG: YbfB/YjiJ family MFS transporter [Beijerinckiaceae bacterium]
MSAARAPVSLALGGMLALAASMGIGRFVYTPILPLMARELGLSSSVLGLIASANFIGYFIGALIAAAPVLPVSRRAALLIALAVSTITTAEMSLVPDVWIFAALRFFGGVASAFVMVLASSLVLDRLRAAQAAHLSWLHFSGIGFGIAVSALAVWLTVQAALGWRGAWIASGALSALAALATVWLVPPDDGSEDSPPLAAKEARGFAVIAFAYGLFGFGYVITATFIVAQVRATGDDTATLEFLTWLIVGVGAMPSVALWIAAANRIGLVRAFACACLVESIGIAASVLWSSVAGLLVAAALFGATFMGIVSLGVMAARQVTTGDPRRAVAVMTAAFSLGQIIGPGFAGIVADRTGTFFAPVMTAALALLVAFILTVRLDPGKT